MVARWTGMRSILSTALLSAALAAGCTVGATGPADTGGGGGDGGGGGGGGGGAAVENAQIAGDITDGATWSGTIELTADATIKSGADIIVAAGAEIIAVQGATLYVEGSLAVEGTAAAPVSIVPADGATTWSGIVVQSGGSATLANATGRDVAALLYCHEGAVFCGLDAVEFTSIGQVLVASGPAEIKNSRISDLANAGVMIKTGADVTITDSYIVTSSHDIIVATGGNLTIDHSEIGGAQGSYEHCSVHIGSAASVSVTNSNIISAVYGVMIGGTDGAVFQYNNFFENDPGNDILEVGTNANADFRYNYWDQGAPTLPDFDTSEPAAALIAEAGPRI